MSVFSCKISDKQVAASGIPIVRINTENGRQVIWKENWINAEITVEGAENEKFNMNCAKAKVKGRGNYTWKLLKKPYAIKFDEKTAFLGMKKHKRFAALANYQDNSFIKNDMAFYFDRGLGGKWCPNGEFANFYWNGAYCGLYWLGEQIKIDKNRIDIDEENEFLLEIDAYFDEPTKFRSSAMKFPYNVKNADDISGDKDAKIAELKQRIDEIECILQENPVDADNLSAVLDFNSFARFYLVQELMMNGHEMAFPKSCYATMMQDGVLRMATVWDFDWACKEFHVGWECDDSFYYKKLLGIPEFRAAIKEVWSKKTFDSDSIAEECRTFCEKLRDAASLDRRRHKKLWRWHKDVFGMVRKTYDNEVKFVCETLQKRFEWMDGEIKKM